MSLRNDLKSLTRADLLAYISDEDRGDEERHAAFRLFVIEHRLTPEERAAIVLP